MEEIIRIPIRRKDGTTYIVTVSASDWPLLSRYNWYVKIDKRRPNTPYVHGRLKGVKRRYNPTVFMHTVIMGPQEAGHQIDHIDHNGLNNTRSNLRSVTEQVNQMNKRPRKGCSSPFKGVSRVGKARKDGTHAWKVTINTKSGARLFVGNFLCEIEAARAYDAAFIKEYGNDIGTNQRLGLLDEYKGNPVSVAA